MFNMYVPFTHVHVSCPTHTSEFVCSHMCRTNTIIHPYLKWWVEGRDFLFNVFPIKELQKFVPSHPHLGYNRVACNNPGTFDLI